MCVVLQKTKFLSITDINIKYATFINVYMHWNFKKIQHNLDVRLFIATKTDSKGHFTMYNA